MNIGILGLLPEQVRIVQQEFPQHALRFLSKDRQSETGMFAKGCDKVVLMTNFIGHDMQDHVPMRKRVPVTGGITKLKRVLNELPTPVRSVPVPPTAKPAAKTNGKGRWSGTAVIDWSPLLTGKAGEEVTILRPATVTLESFRHRLDVGRSQKKASHGVITSPPRMIDGGAVVTIKTAATTPTPKKRHSKATEPVASLETTAPDTTPADTPQETHDMQIAIEVQRPVAMGAPVLTQARESAFWQSVFVETMRQWPGAPVDTIAARADEALRAYNARVGMTVNAH